MATDYTHLNKEDSPYESVRMAVSNEDDPSLPSLTFRAWFLGIVFCVLLSFINQFYWFRQNQLSLGASIVQLLSFPVGYLMAKLLPTNEFSTFGFAWSLNPGPFNIKEHVLVTITASSCAHTAYAIDVVAIKKLWYKSDLGFGASYLFLLTSQMLGYSFAGVARRFLIYPPSMVWPATLITATLFRAFHKSKQHGKERAKLSRNTVFWIAFAASFVWYFLPGYLFPALSALPILCMIAPKNVIAHQMADGNNGLGILNFTLDWSTVASYMFSPISYPWPMLCNVFFGFVMIAWVITPIGYYTNTWGTGVFPIYSTGIFLANGSDYDIAQVMTEDQKLDPAKYSSYGPLRMTFMLAVNYGLSFAAIISILVYVALHYGGEIIQRIKTTSSSTVDIHMKLMQTYKEVPQWWYAAIFVATLVLAIVTCEVFKMLPWYWVVLSILISFVFTIPIGIIQAISNKKPSLAVITEFIIGYGMPGDPIANVTFKVYGFIVMIQALSLLQDQKLGHYMKIPPRHMFLAQITGTIVAGSTQLGVAYWLMNKIDNICQPANLLWPCRKAAAFYAESVIWGLIGPSRILGKDSPYHAILYLLLLGCVLPIPVWYLHRRYPDSFWKNVHVPIILSLAGVIPPVPTHSIVNWFIAGFILVYCWSKYFHRSWATYAFVISAGLDAGMAICGIFIFYALNDARAPDWWGTNRNFCKLARVGGYLTPRH